MVPAVAFAGTFGDDGAYYADNTVPAVADCTIVQWNGLTWDIIGYNNGTVAHGVAGDPNTVTLLLDKASYDSTFDTQFNDYVGDDSDNEYSGSDLQTKLADIYSGFADKVGVVPRDLAGGSGFSTSDGSNTSTGPYTGNTIAGNPANAQNLWPLSVTEASQLKASERAYGSTWWLRSPGGGSHAAGVVDGSGHVISYGDIVNGTYSSRPALYLNLSSSNFTSLSTAISSDTLKIGAYDKTLSVTDSEGYTWDIVGVNGTVNKGVATPSGYATLLLSNFSAKKFGFPDQSYTGFIRGKYDPSEVYGNKYTSSDLKNAMASAYEMIKENQEYDGKILARNFAGAAFYDDDSEDVAGADVPNQKLWPLSVTEAKTLSNQERIYGGYNWWLRSPGNSDDDAGIVTSDGHVYSYGDYVGAANSSRPALYLNLSSSLFASLPSGWQARYGTNSGWPVAYKVTFDSNGGSAVDNLLVAEGSAIGDLPTTTRAGYTFAGWWTAATGGSQINANTIPAADVTYYAHWDKVEPIKYTITFNANKGKISKTDAKKTVESGKAIGKLPIPKRTGYTFKGWYTTKAAGTKIKTTTKITANKTYYAHWVAKKYTVKLNPNGGKKLAAKKAKLKVTYAKKYGKLTTPTKTGYKFLGWYTKKKAGTKITAKTTVKITKTTTLYAHWKKK
jgi:uncharacterized repeat protein (TIGR02543 family)